MIEVVLRRAGQPRQTYDFDEGATIADFKSLLGDVVSTSGIANSRFAVGGEPKEDSYELQNGDQLTVVNKVDGGVR